jgi:hypothetical protein
MTTIKNNLPENLIYDILSYRLCNFNDIMVVASLNKTFNNLIKEKKTELLFYKNVYDFISKCNRFECYYGNYKSTSFEHLIDNTYTKHMTSGFAVVNDTDLCKIKNILKKYKFKKSGKIKKMKFYKILPGTWPSVTGTLTGHQSAIRFVIF